MIRHMSWKSIAAAKQKAVRDKIPVEWRLSEIPSVEDEPNAAVYLDKLLPSNVVDITSSTLSNLAQKISSGKLTSLEVTKAFCHRAAYAHQMLNCCVEIFFDEALDRASKLDEHFKTHGRTIGPLHGLPISLKDQVNLPGKDSSIGYVSLINKPKTAADKSTLAQVLEDLGAVFYVKTTVPMAMMSSDTWSNVMGYTQNAVNRKLSAGGSSGGEGALIAAGGSILGFGTDIGGSIRIPSSFNGIYGLRPSSGRISYQKVDNSYRGQSVMPSVIGPMAKDLDDLELITKILFNSEQWKYDSKIIPVSWRPYLPENGVKPTFGVERWDLMHPVDPPVARAIEMVIESLEKAGHQVIEWQPQYHDKILRLAYDIYHADGGKEVRETCEITGEPPTVIHKEADPPITVNEFWEYENRKVDLQEKYLKSWQSTASKTVTKKPVDAWITPSWISASFLPYDLEDPDYTAIQNVLDLPVVIVPVTNVDKKIDSTRTNRYDPDLFDGAPVCIQVITKRWEEEKAIALAKVVRDVLKH